MTRLLTVSVVFAALSLFLTIPSAHAATQTAPATSGAAEALQIEIIGIQGTVQYRTAEDQKWQRAQIGMKLDENAELRTSTRSAVQFEIPPDQVITLDRVGVIKVLQAVRDGNKVTTRLGMKYGRTRYDIQAAGLEHDSTLASPSATLALTGTDMVTTDQRPFPAQVLSVEGQARFRDFKKTVSIGTKGSRSRAVANTEKRSAADVSLAQSVIDPTVALAHSAAEANLVAHLLSNGAQVEFDYEKGIKVIRGGSVPTADAELIPLLPGRLNFVMRWENNTDLNLLVFTPAQGQNLCYPIAGYNTLPSGAHIDFDHRGGTSGGIEICSWPNAEVPAGTYTIAAVKISGQDTPGTLDAFLDGQRLPIQTGEIPPPTTAHFTGEVQQGFTGVLIGNVQISDDQAVLPQSAPASRKPSKAKLTPLTKRSPVPAPVPPPTLAANKRQK